MDLYTPGSGLVIWQLVILVLNIILPAYCLIDLYRKRAVRKQKNLWALLIIFIPVFGSIAYLVNTYRSQSKTTV